MNDKKILFARMRDGAKIPSKKSEDAGFDIYANFDEKYIEIKPNEIKMIPTGICSAFSDKYVAILKERGSTGTKGMAVRCGVIDSGYRGEWLVPINNTSNKTIYIVKKEYMDEIDDYKNVKYPYEKAICQAVLLNLAGVESEEVCLEYIQSLKTERMDGKLGSSGK